MNKKASKWLSPYLFFILGFTGVMIVIGVLIFNSAKIDVRKDESEFLANKILDCLIDEGDYDLNFESEDYFFVKCGIEKKIIDNGNYYMNVSIYSSDKTEKIIEKGVRDFALRCELGKTAEGDFPKCSTKKFPIKFEGVDARVVIFIASSNLGNNL